MFEMSGNLGPENSGHVKHLSNLMGMQPMSEGAKAETEGGYHNPNYH